MLPSWFVPLVLVSSLVGWTMIIYTLVTMIRTKKAQRLAREAAAAAVAAANGTLPPEAAPQP
jgi:hypothetical protein